MTLWTYLAATTLLAMAPVLGSSGVAAQTGPSPGKNACAPASGPEMMTAAQRKKLLAALARVGGAYTLYASVASYMCVHNGGRPVPVKQIAVGYSTIKLAFGQFELGAKDYYFAVDTKPGDHQGTNYVFRTDPLFRLIGSVVEKTGAQVSTLPAERSRAAYQAQIRLWTRVADQE
jgi:hypothetical protein